MGVFEYLSNHRVALGDWPGHQGPGVYALFALNRDCLPAVILRENALIYIGRSGDLAKRDHIRPGGTGQSTVRRSLGAILKADLRLTAIHRGRTPSVENIRNFRFAKDGEERLTGWMLKNLQCANYRNDGNIVALERQLIVAHRPPLCLSGWPNPQREVIKALRRVCRDEARADR